MPRLHQILRGIKSEHGNPSCTRLPITPGILRKLRMSWVGKDSSFKSTILWAASLTAFFTFFHSGEITVEAENQCDPNTHLSFGDVVVDNPTNPTINIPQH